MPPRVLLRTLLLTSVLALALAACGSEGGSAAPQAGSADTSAAVPATPSQPSSSPDAIAAGKPSVAAVPAVLDFSASTVAGDGFEGASLAGKPAVLWFWAPWCPTCRGQIDGVSALADEYGATVNFVGVGSLDEASAIAGFAGDVPADFPHLLDPEGAVWRHFGVIEQSSYVVLDADSTVVSEGYLDDSALEDLVTGLAG